MISDRLYDFLETKFSQYNSPLFIEKDPVSIPHRFSKAQDIEISGFLAASLAWGQRPVIIRNTLQLMEWMDNDPYKFITDFQKKDLLPFRKFVHRTFNGEDCMSFLSALKAIYRKFHSLEGAFCSDLNVSNQGMDMKISNFKHLFFQVSHAARTEKHLSDPLNGSAAKRFNMYLRWMVRQDKAGVDFGIWKKIKPSELMLPLDVHSARVARSLQLLKRKQNDWKAVSEVTETLRKFDRDDPVKYDYALFGLGVFEKFS